MAEKKKTIAVRVRTLEGPGFTLTAPPDLSVGAFKSRIEAAHGHSADKMQLVCGGRSLTSGETLTGAARGAPTLSMYMFLGLSSPSAPQIGGEQTRASLALRRLGFTEGLEQCLGDSMRVFTRRIWILDNSGSMSMGDACHFVPARKKGGGDDGWTPNERLRLVPCTRWEELRDAVLTQAKLCVELQAPVSFRLLNPPTMGRGCSEANRPQQFLDLAAAGASAPEAELAQLNATMRSEPGGYTPLAARLREVCKLVRRDELELRRSGRRVCVVVATDGMPTTRHGESGVRARRDFVAAMKELQRLPVWVVVRLCTDDDSVCDFYNDLDKQLEAPLEVLDDLCSEAREVGAHNPWLCYCAPLHALRLFGTQSRLLYAIDERPLSLGEAHGLCLSILGCSREELPQPLATASDEDTWDAFEQGLKRQLAQIDPVWNPQRKSHRPLIDAAAFRRAYDPRAKKRAFVWKAILAVCLVVLVLFALGGSSGGPSVSTRRR